MTTRMKATAKPSMAATTKPLNITMGVWALTCKTDSGQLYGSRATLQAGGYKKTFEAQGKDLSNQRASLECLLIGLRAIKKSGAVINLYTASKYVKINLHDLHNMKARQWKSRIGEPLAYPELWKEVYDIILTKSLTINIHLLDRTDDRLIEPMQRLSALAKHEVQASIMEVSRK